MNRELKILLITIGVSLGFIWLLKPKKETDTKKVEDKYSEQQHKYGPFIAIKKEKKKREEAEELLKKKEKK